VYCVTLHERGMGVMKYIFGETVLCEDAALGRTKYSVEVTCLY
jgi:hypothetical protein